ncbi:hypothetical protein WJ05_00495 [Burkholderia vietnamiensis]|uniref:hypothetical protein n=1 Tax=Burkholderia vietnamiensis TaxID=60552 RepID=UPI000753E151|nr:hypothetical protein [Burkholderia vietnamiensis]KVF11926.1 hypothetical protein WJ05_00495 [Burkholderia vietnamiensis]
MSTDDFTDAVDLAIAKLRRMPEPEADSNLAWALAGSITDLSALLGILESGLVGPRLREAKEQAQRSLTALIFSADGGDTQKIIDELKQAFIDADCPLEKW